MKNNSYPRVIWIGLEMAAIPETYINDFLLMYIRQHGWQFHTDDFYEYCICQYSLLTTGEPKKYGGWHEK